MMYREQKTKNEEVKKIYTVNPKTTKTGTEMNEIENKYMMERINKVESWSFKTRNS